MRHLEKHCFVKLRKKTGLDVDIIKFVGVYNRIFPDRHGISIVYLCGCSDDNVILNDEHSDFKFFKDIPTDINQYLLITIQDMKK